MAKLLNGDAMTRYNSHTHSQGNDSDGDTQVDTGVPNQLMVEDTHTTTDTEAS